MSDKDKGQVHWHLMQKVELSQVPPDAARHLQRL
jgi:hypothetical protein